MQITSNIHGREVEMEYSPDIAELVSAIEAAGSIHDGVIQAWEMAKLFPAQPNLHTTTMESTALLAAGCILRGDACCGRGINAHYTPRAD